MSVFWFFRLSVHPSVCPHEETRLPLDGVSWNFILQEFSKMCSENSSFIETGQEWRVLTWRPKYVHIWSYRSHSFSEWNIFQKKLRKLGTHILRSIRVFSTIVSLWDNVEMSCRGGQVTDGNIAHAHCTLDTLGYKHTLRLCNACCFSTATFFVRTRLNVTLHAHCLGK